MVFSEEDRIVIKVLRQEKGYGAKRLMNEFPGKQWKRSGLEKLLRKIDATGSIERKPGSGGRRTAATEINISAVNELALSQEDQPGTHRTVREIARDLSLSKTNVHRIIRNDLKLKCFKKRRAQELTESNKLKRLVCSKQLLRKYPEHAVKLIWFTDEKVFTVERPTNFQNDRIYAALGTKKKQVSSDRLLRTCSTFSKSVMVSVAVSVLGHTELLFVEPGVKVNGQYYRDVLLKQQMLPAIREMSGDVFTFQQDNAPAHRARETVQLLAAETPDFIPPSLWPPNSPDLNPVDYKIWGVLQDRVYRTRIQNVDQLKERLRNEWDNFEQQIIEKAISQWRKRLRACVKESGGHFEHIL